MTHALKTLALSAVIALSACAAPFRILPPIAPEAAQSAVLPGYGPGIRFWADGTEEASARAFLSRVATSRRQIDADGTLDILALSAGGADGAFGAGVLRGWSERGDRPEFDIVTGVSTGAIIAPFAFIGDSLDVSLERFFTRNGTRDLLSPTVIQLLRGGPSVASSSPLADIVAREITDEFVARIAAEHARGRRLLVASTNLDAQRPVVWDLGEIASTGNEDAAIRIQEIILASAAIPGLFPPREIGVLADGRIGGELHVDGAVTREAFLLPDTVGLAAFSEARGQPGERIEVHVVLNSKIEPVFANTNARALNITNRAIETLILAQTRADASRISERVSAAGGTARFIAVPQDLEITSDELFDPVAMTALYETGRRLGREGIGWRDDLVTPIDLRGPRRRPRR